MTGRITTIAAFLLALTQTLYAQDAPPSGLAALRVPDGFEVEVAAGSDLAPYAMFMTFDDQGRLFIAESSGKDLSGKEMAAAPECTILLLEDLDDDGVFDTSKVFADKLSLPMGVLWYQGSVYVASPPDFIRFEDTDGDGVADVRDVLLTGWNVLNTASLHGPFLSPDGWLYLTHGRHGYKIATKEGGTLEGMAARIWRCKPDGTHLERMCGGGFDNPVELIYTDAGEVIGTMTYFTDPRNGQRDALMHWVEGGAYPKPHEVTGELVRTGDLMPTMTMFARIAPAGLLQYRSSAFGPEFAGNLFSAHFNPHRIQRHILSRDGATFRTEDSDFLTSVIPDFHPTDVLEDADGSLLVSDTGGWYVDACPLSRVARPEVKGTIYRIRRTGAETPADPWGKSINFEKLSDKKVASLLADERPRVRDRAVEALVARGADRALAAVFNDKDASESQRIQAFWALTRIGGNKTGNAILAALDDSNATLRTAAARAVSTSIETDEPFKSNLVATLVPLLNDGEPQVRREAAAALGRLGDPSCTRALLQACASAEDRFIEHALIYSLILLRNDEAISVALANAEPRTRKAALIALDQMKSPKLQQDAIVPFLNDSDEALRRAGLWVASRHPEWSPAVTEYLATQLRSDEFDPESSASIREVLLAYANDGTVQSLIAELLERADATRARSTFLLDTVDQASLAELPASWTARLGELLDSPDADLRWRAASIVRSRGIAQFDDKLAAIASDANQPLALRVGAIGTLAQRNPKLSDAQYKLLVANLGKEIDPTVRLACGKVLAKAELSPTQLRELARDVLPKAEPVTFAALLDAFRGKTDVQCGLALVKSLENAPVNVNVLSGGIDELLASYPESVKSAAEPIRAQAEADAKQRIERLLALEPALQTGDVGRGRHLFFSETLACSTCHAVGPDGGTLGPDLTAIGAIRSGHDLLEAVLFPSASYVPLYEPYVIETAGGESFQGVIRQETSEAITLMTAANAEARIPRSEIASMTISSVSTMPEGLDAAMSQQDLLDLMAFLQSLNKEQWLLPERREAPK